MEILTRKVNLNYIRGLSQNWYGDMIKAVADIENSIIAIDAELHSDLERLLLENGSKQESLWGFNIYPDLDDEEFVEFDSLINIRPRQNNRSRDVENPTIREKIISIVDQYIDR